MKGTKLTMKTKNILIAILSLAMMLTLSIPAFAADPVPASTTGSITVSPVAKDTTIDAYQIIKIEKATVGEQEVYQYTFTNQAYKIIFADFPYSGNGII